MKKIFFTLLLIFGLTVAASAQVKRTVTTTEVTVPTPPRPNVRPLPPGTVIKTKRVVHRHPRRRRVVKRTVTVPVPVIETKTEITN